MVININDFNSQILKLLDFYSTPSAYYIKCVAHINVFDDIECSSFVDISSVYSRSCRNKN